MTLKEKLRKFPVQDLIEYITNHDWIYKGRYPKKGLVFEKGKHSIFIPTNKKFSDYDYERYRKTF